MAYYNEGPPGATWKRYPAKATREAGMYAVARLRDKKIREEAQGLALIEQTISIKRPEFKEVGSPAFRLTTGGGPANVTTRSGVHHPTGDPAFRSEFDSRERAPSEPFTLLSIRPKHWLRPEEEFAAVAPHNTLIRHKDQKPYDYFGPLLEDMPKRNSARVDDVGFPGQEARTFGYEKDVHIGPMFVSGLGEISRKATIKQELRSGKLDINLVLARIRRRREERAEAAAFQEELNERELELQRQSIALAKQRAGKAVGRTEPAPQTPGPQAPQEFRPQFPVATAPERPAWLIPAAIGGGLLLISGIVLARK